MEYFLNQKLQEVLLSSKVGRLDKVLLILFWDHQLPKTVQQIQNIGYENGLREVSKWNVSDILRNAKGKAILSKGCWSLTSFGITHLAQNNFISTKTSVTINDALDLRVYLSKIKNAETYDFLEEAILCLENDQKRASVVFSWIGAVSLLYKHVVDFKLAQFNADALKKDPKWKVAKNTDDLGKMKEYDFLNILESISVIGKNVKQELHHSLQLRNSCGHPNSLKIGARKVSAHIETLILNIFCKFG